MRHRRSGPITAALAAGAVLGAAAAGEAGRIREEPVSESPRTLPVDLELPARDGEPFRFADLIGHRVLIVTWASW